ncbi:MAG: acyl-CoA dehydrogenase [Plesiomonas sp.]
MTSLRQRYLSGPAFKVFKRILPPLSATEREAMEAGTVWWEGDLFRGKPNWDKLHALPKPVLTAEEQAFMDNQVETLLNMLDDYQIVHELNDLPKEVWDYLKQERFFSLIISKEFGGRAFSALANSTIVTKIASKSTTAAVTVMVPNSLGPGELLSHYGTEEQKQRWLPGLADGREIPCFALTGPEAGSDAGSIPDKGVVCRGQHEGRDVLGIRLNWNKRYITLAPVATVLGLAFKLHDPDGLLGDKEDIGITCALIPTNHPGVDVGARHIPMNLAFMNGPTWGKDVFIPLDWIIGGAEYAGKGWRMLVECLSAGRGISLPALGTAIGHLTTRTTGAYSYVRKQFGMSIGRFEGVAEAMGRIGGLTYLLEASRTLTTTALDTGEIPGIVTAIAKYHMTEIGRKLLNDSMDVHAGRAIQLGEMNYLGHHYFGIPVAITVEGANILTRNLMIFGQGATRCHPFVLGEMEAAANPDEAAGLQAFDDLLFKHIGFGVSNFFSTFWQGITAGKFSAAPDASPLKSYYKQLSRMSRALALTADMAMLVLGGDLKRKEMLSARLGDVLSNLYLASAVLKRYEQEGRLKEDLPLAEYGLQYCLYECGKAFDSFFQNFPNRVVARLLRTAVFPYGVSYKPVSDDIALTIAKLIMIPGAQRDRLTKLCFVGQGADEAINIVESAFQAMYAARGIEKKLAEAQRSGALPRKVALEALITAGLQKGVINDAEAKQMREADELRSRAVQVDHVDGPHPNPARAEREEAA